MTWNYRVVRQIDPNGDEYLAVHEVFYDKDGNPNKVTVDPVPSHGNTLMKLRDNHAVQSRAFNEPILNYADIFSKEADNG